MNEVSVIPVESDLDLKSCFNIRREVFIEEQEVTEEEEFDEYDSSSKHFLALLDGIPVGTARIRKTEEGIKLERFCVLKNHRSNKVGQSLVVYLLEEAKKYNTEKIYLHSQLTVKNFYQKFDFYAVGPEFEEAGIKHIQMIFMQKKGKN